MKLFKKKEKKQENEDGGIWIVKMALQEAMRELQEERAKNESLRKDLEIMDKQDLKKQLDETIKLDKKKIKELQEQRDNYKNNLEVLQTTIENIRKICKDRNGRVISSITILKELGE